MNKSISISNPTKVLSLIVEPVGNGDKIGGNLDLKIFTNATEIKVAALDIEDLGELPANLITLDASDNKITELKNFNLGTDVRTFNLKTNKLSALDIDKVLSQFDSNTLVDVGSLIDISGFGNSLVDNDNRSKIAELQNKNWTVNYNNYAYTMRADSATVEEGAILSVAINTTAYNVKDGTEVPYTITGIQANDILQDLTGNFIVTDNRASINFNIKADVGIPAYDESDSFTIALDDYVGMPSVTIPVIDTTPSPFALTAVSSSKEGQTFNITISTVNCDVPDGTIVPYTISGTIDANDIQQPFTGSFVINSNVDTIPINVISDNATEGTEVLTITLDDYPTTMSIDLYDVTYDLKSTSDDPSDSSFAYGGATEITSIDEGGKFYVALKTEGLVSGSVPYVISGISASDINEPLTGNFSVSNNIGHKEFNVSEDYQTDAGETFTLTLVNGFASTAVTIGDTFTDPTITMSSSPIPGGSKDEGGIIVIAMQASELPDGHEVPYTITGVQAADFKASGFDGGAAPSDLKGKFTITSNGSSNYAVFQLAEDATTEGPETLTLTLDDYPSNTISIDVNDTSLTPTFALSTTESSSGSPLLPTVNEGVSFDITLTTQNIADGTNIPYTITGIQSTDITGSLTGNFTISSGTATETITVTNDTLTEGEEILKLKLDSYSEEIEIRISDTSITAFALSNDVNNLADEGDEVEFELTTTDTAGNYGYILTGVEVNGTSLTANDFESGTGLTTSLSGTFAASGSKVKYKLKEDNITEGTLTMSMILEDVDSDGNSEAQSTVIVNDTSIETYALSGTTTVAENGSTTITLTTQGVPDNTTLPFTISGTNITTNDFVGLSSLTGDFTVSSNTASITFNISADGIAEDATETFTLALDNGAASIDVDITDSVFTLDTNVNTVNEGQSFTITLNTFGLLADGTEVPYTVSGTNITTADFEGEAGASLTGSFIVQNSTATKTFTVANDFTTEAGSEIFVITLDDYAISETVEIVDSSQDPTFVLTSNKSAISETGGDGTGDYFGVTLTTTGVPDNTLFPYTISGSGVTTDDFDELLNNPETALDRNYSSVYAHTGIYYNNGTTHDRSPQGQSQLDYMEGSWAPAEIDSRNYTTVIDFGDTEATLDVSALQNSTNRAVMDDATTTHMTIRGDEDVEPIIITLNNHTLSTGDEVRMTINADFVGPIAEGFEFRTTLHRFNTEIQTESILLGVITQTTEDTFTVQLYNSSSYYGGEDGYPVGNLQYRHNERVPTVNQGFYKSINVMPLGTDQTAIPFDGVRLEKFEEKQSLGSWMKIYTYGQEVTGLTTQGRTSDMRDYDNLPNQQELPNAWVKSYRVQYRDGLAHDGISELDWINAGNFETGSSISGQGHRWFDVDGGRIFTGHGHAAAPGTNTLDPEEGSKKVTNTFNTPVVATEIKIIPVTYYRWPSMRAAAVADVSLSGRSFRVFNNEAKKSFKVRSDLTTEGTESITFTLTDSRSISPDNTFTVSVADDSLDPEDMPLDILNVGMTNEITARSKDSVSLYTNIDYTADPTTLDSQLTGKDVVMVDGVNWNRHYLLKTYYDQYGRPTNYYEQTNTYGFVYPNATTMDKLKDFVINGGTLISMTEHGSYNAYLHPHPPNSHYNPRTQMSFPCQIIYDLGGITGANGGWKSQAYGGTSAPLIAHPSGIGINAVTSGGFSLISVASETVINSRSNGIPLFYYSLSPLASQVHMWDGALGHLNSNVKGKIIFMGDSQLKGYSTSQYNRYRDKLINPLFDYISRNRVY